MVTSIKGNDTSTFGGNVDVTGNVITDAPAFSVTKSATQAISTGTFTKVIFDTEAYDTNSNFDSTTNYRFTPTVAGYYHFNAGVTTTTVPSANSGTYMTFYYNGSRADGKEAQVAAITGLACNAFNSATFYMNGTTDYVELYIYFPSAAGAQTLSADNYRTYFQGHLVRAV